MANYQVDNIEMSIKATAEEAIKALDLAITKSKQLNETMSTLNSGLKQTASGAKNLNSEFKNLGGGTKGLLNTSTQIQGINKDSKELSNTMKRGFNIAGMLIGLRAMTGLVKKSLNLASEFGENYNLFHVSMGSSADKAMEFQKSMNSILGTNMSESMRFQGFFKALAESLGIASDSAYKMSENLTKLTYDLASLYNIDFDEMYMKLQSGLVGQTKPMRSVGVDVTQQTLQGYLDNMGFDVAIQQLSQAEKVMLRYIAILDQTKIAHSDYAVTIESPANAIRVFKDQVKELYVWIGNTFIGLFSKIIPYVNGFVLALKEVFKAIATLFGFSLSDYEFDHANSIGSDLDDIGVSADKTGKKIKKVMGLLGFNEINNIKVPDTSGDSGAVGGIGGAGIYDDLALKLGEYDNLMSKVSMKATDIRNKILDWLGFQYDINALTGELTNLKWGGFGAMATSAKVLLGILGSIIALKLAKWIGSAYEGFKILGKTIGENGLIKNFRNLFSLLFSNIKSYGFVKGVKEGTTAWWGMQSTLAKVTIGVVALGAGMTLASSGAKDWARQGDLTTESTSKLVGGLASATAGGAALGSVIPGVGTAVGAFAGFAIGATTALFSWSSEMEKIRYEAELFDGIGLPIDEYADSVKRAMDSLVGANDKTVEWIVKNKESKERLSEVIDAIDLLNIKMSNNLYKVTADDVAILNKSLEDMSNEVKISGEAFTNATISITEKLKDEGKISQETADLVVGNAIRKAEAEGQFMESYSIKMKDLTTKLEKGQITQDEYRESVAKLQKEFNSIIGVSEELASNFEILTDKAGNKIDLKNWSALKTSISDISTEYETQDKKQTEVHKTMLKQNQEAIDATNKQLGILQSNGKSETDEYSRISKELDALKSTREGLTKSFEDESKSLDTIVATSFGNIISQLNSTGESMTKEGKEISSDLIQLLSNMGYEVNFEDGVIKTITDSEGNIIKAFENVGSKMGTEMANNSIEKLGSINTWLENNDANMGVDLNTSSAYKSANELKSTIGGMRAKLSVDLAGGSGLSLSNSGSVFSQINIRGYKTGGFPDGENGLFYANNTEMVGKFTNGRTAVANNDQIVSGIERGVTNAMSRVLESKSFGGDVTVINQMDGREISRHTYKFGLENEMVRG